MDCEFLEVFYHKGSFCNLEMGAREDIFLCNFGACLEYNMLLDFFYDHDLQPWSMKEYLIVNLNNKGLGLEGMSLSRDCQLPPT